MNQDLTMLTVCYYCAILLECFVLSFGKKPIQRGQHGHFDERSDSDLS